MTKYDACLCIKDSSMHVPDHAATAILECRSFCAFGKGLNTNPPTTVQRLAQDIDRPWKDNRKAWKGYKKAWKGDLKSMGNLE